jgi:hypothetical protein
MASLGRDALDLLALIVDAFNEPNPGTSTREPLDFFRSFGGSRLQHHALTEHFDQPVGETDVEELSDAGFLSIEYGHGNWRLTPTAEGRAIVEDFRLAQDTELTASAERFLKAAAEQSEASNPLAWIHVRELLIGLRDHWQAAGFPATGIRLSPLLHALPSEHDDTANAGLRALMADDYLLPQTDIALSSGIPALMSLTPKAFQALDGWPSESPRKLYEHLIAAIEEQQRATTDPERNCRLAKAAESLRELGVSTASGVLTTFITGGA